LELIRKEVEPGTVALGITGEVRTSNDRQQLTQGVEEEIQKGVRRIILDLGALQIVDSAGIGTIVLCFSHVKKAGGTLRLAGARGMVENVLKLTQIHRAIDLFPSVEDAAKNFPPSN
jgi:anti-sigma B factor antagonist